MKRLLIVSLFTILAIPAWAMPTEREIKPCCRSTPKWYAGFTTAVGVASDVNYGYGWGQSYKPGVGASGSVGYLIHPDIGIELEGSYRRNDDDKVTIPPGGTSDGEKSAKTTTTAMANAIYTHHTDSLFSPYIGAGAGMALIDQHVRFSNGSETITLKDWAPAYQFLAGISYDLPNTPIELILGYRYMTTNEASKSFPSTQESLRFKSSVQSVELGLKLHF